MLDSCFLFFNKTLKKNIFLFVLLKMEEIIPPLFILLKMEEIIFFVCFAKGGRGVKVGVGRLVLNNIFALNRFPLSRE